MARKKYHDEDLSNLKRNISLEALCRSRGIELQKHGSRDLIGKCPFHDDENPSFIVTPEKNLFHCMGCDAAGSVIDLVMKLDGLTLREAIDKLITSTGLVSKGTELEKAAERKKSEVPTERAAALLERTLAVYEKNFTDHPEARAYLEGRGITDAALFSRFRIGYCNGKLTEMLPGNGQVRAELNATGILLDPIPEGSTPKRERFTGCVVFPVFDAERQLTTIYGRSIGDGEARHLFLPSRSTGIWNAQAIKTDPSIIITESVIDALSVMVAGFHNVIAIQGTNGLKGSDIETFKHYSVESVTLLLDGDQAGAGACIRYQPMLEEAGLEVKIKTLPLNQDPNSVLVKNGAGALQRLLAFDITKNDLPEPEPVSDAVSTRAADASVQATGKLSDIRQSTPDSLSFTYGLRTYKVLGLDKGNQKLRATVRVEFAGKLHVDTLDFYSARSRRMLAQDLCRILDEAPETIEGDLTRLLQACEKAAAEKKEGNADNRPAPVVIPQADRKDAEIFGKRPDLIDIILNDFEILGLIGEKANKLLGYLAMTSRKMLEPLSILILSSSGAGKTALQDAVCSFCPPEDLVKLTSLSGKALFYKDRLALKHKVLALEEGDGAEEASYAIRNLISAAELVIESTIKDLATGRLTTMENKVEGPSSVLMTTTRPDTDPETKSRFWVTSVDESREQTRKIIAFQRQRQTLEGVQGSLEVEAIHKRHRNFQRLLKPLAVVNPFADQLTYADDRLQGRRDHQKYLNLIKAVTFLYQMQRDIKKGRRSTGENFDYIEVSRDDMKLANSLAHEILGHSLDELSRPSRMLLLEIEKMVREWIKKNEKDADQAEPERLNHTSFSRRQIRQYTGWSNYRVHTHLKELIEYEYLSVETDRATGSHRYRLQYEGQGKDGEKFMLGLINPNDLD